MWFVKVAVSAFHKGPYTGESRNTWLIYIYRRRVEPKEGEDLAKEMECAWIETSAKDNINIGSYFGANDFLNSLFSHLFL